MKTQEEKNKKTLIKASKEITEQVWAVRQNKVPHILYEETINGQPYVIGVYKEYGELQTVIAQGTIDQWCWEEEYHDNHQFSKPLNVKKRELLIDVMYYLNQVAELV